MEVLKTENVPTLLSNVELLHILSARLRERAAIASSHDDDNTTTNGMQHRRPSVNPKLLDRNWIEENVYEYLQNTPCAKLDLKKMRSLVSVLKSHTSRVDDDENGTKGEGGFGLTDAETLQILNLVPKEMVEIHLIIEDMGSRLSDEQQSALLDVISKYASNEKEGDEKGMEDEIEVDQQEGGEEEMGEEEIWGEDL